MLSPGFQMSFAATLALVAGYERWRRRPPRDRNALIDAVPGLSFLGRFAGGLVATSLLGGVSTMVYAAAHFHTVTLYGLAGNILAMPVVSLIVMPAGVAAMLAMPFGLDAPILWLMALGIRWMVAAADLVAGWGEPLATGRLWPPGLVMIAVGGAVMCMLRTWLAAWRPRPRGGGVDRHCRGSAGATGRHDFEDGRLVGVRIGDAMASTAPGRPPSSSISGKPRGYRHLRQAFGGGTSQDTPDDTKRRRGSPCHPPKQGRCWPNCWRALLRTLAALPAAPALAAPRSPLKAGGSSPSTSRPCSGRPATRQTLSSRAGRCASTTAARRPPVHQQDAARNRRGGNRAGQRWRALVHPAFSSLSRSWQRHRAYDWRSGHFTDEPLPAMEER